MKKIKYLLSLLTFLVFILAAGGSDDSSSSKTPQVGEMCTMTHKCFGAVSEKAYDEVVKYCNAKDEVGMAQLVSLGLAAPVNEGECGKVLELGFLKTQVRFDNGVALYVPTDYVQKLE